MREDANKMKNILIFGPYLPGKSYGGPVKSILNMVEALSNDYNFYIVTNDRDLNSSVPYQEVDIGSWNNIGNAKVFYMPQGKELKYIKYILKNLNYDMVYASSFFSRSSIIIQMMCRLNYIKKPIIVAPRGEFSSGALAIKSFKKKLFLSIYKLLKVPKKIVYTCSSEGDRKDILNILGSKTQIYVAGNIVSSEINIGKIIKNKVIGELRIATLSRISRIKNIDFSLQLLESISKNNDVFNEIIFDIYGPLEDKDYWEECLRIINRIGHNIQVNYKGLIDYSDVLETLLGYHIFLFPTKGENFGHVIQEALLAGCPVVISDQTPWKELNILEVGFDIPLNDPDKFIDTIKSYLYMDNKNYKFFSEKATEHALYKIRNQITIQEHREMFDAEMKVRNELSIWEIN